MISAALNGYIEKPFRGGVYGRYPNRNQGTRSLRRYEHVGNDVAEQGPLCGFVGSCGSSLTHGYSLAHGVLEVSGNAASGCGGWTGASSLELGSVPSDVVLTKGASGKKSHQQDKEFHGSPLGVNRTPSPAISSSLAQGAPAPNRSRVRGNLLTPVGDVVPSLGQKPFAGEVSASFNPAPTFAALLHGSAASIFFDLSR